MTNKMASEVLKVSSIQQMGFCKVIVDGKLFSVKEALDTAIEVLEQEPCEDCISRQEALNVVHKYFEHYLQLNDDICLDGLRSLPSVTPKEKTGHWIVHPKGIYAHLVCDKCLSNAPYDCRTDFCPNCGTKMEVNE